MSLAANNCRNMFTFARRHICTYIHRQGTKTYQLRLLACLHRAKFSTSNFVCHKAKPFPVLENVTVSDTSPNVSESQRNMEAAISGYKAVLSTSLKGGSEKAVKHHKMQKKLLVEERLALLLDDECDFLEFSPLAGMGMDYGDVPRAGVMTGVGRVNGVYCMVILNDATIKGGTVYPITLKKQLRAQEISEQNHLPCVYAVDSGGAYLPLQAEIFPDRNHGGRVFYNEAVLSAKGIQQIAVVCGNCTAGGAYIPTMADEAIIIQKIGRIFLGGPPLVKAATGEVVTADDLGGAVLHSTVSGCTDHYSETEEEAFAICRDVMASLNAPLTSVPQESDAPLYNPEELTGLIPTNIEDYDVHKILSRLVDGSRFHEFKKLYGKSLVTGFSHIDGYLVGIVANKGEITGDGAAKGAHFIQMCSERSIPLVFLQNSSSTAAHGDKLSGEALGETVKGHAKMLSAVSLASVPKLTVILGGSYGINNYLMAGRAMSPNFLFMWPSATIGAFDIDNMTDHFIEGTPGSDSGYNQTELKDKLRREMSAVFSSTRILDDGVILPQDTRQVLGQCLRIVSQGAKYEKNDAGVIRM